MYRIVDKGGEGIKDYYEFRGLIYFEIFTHDGHLLGYQGYKADWRYILTQVWKTVWGYTIISTGKECKMEKVRTDRNPQTFTVTNTVSNLVDKYIAHPFGPGVKIGDKRIIPVRNMRPDDKEGLKLGYAPLNEEEMTEFKRLLRIKDPERHKLSFS